MRRFALIALPLLTSISYAQPRQQGQANPEIREKYNKFEYGIPMRDGVKLYTSVYVPKNADGHSPIMLSRTPYSAGPYGPDRYRSNMPGSHKFIDNNYIFAFQDVRGRYMSEGEFVDVRPEDGGKYHANDIDESTDTYDTIDFLIKNVPGNNGRVGMWGISYPGFYTACGGIDSHPALKAISPQAPVSEWFIGDDFHHNGAFFLQDAFDFYHFFGLPHPGPIENYSGGTQIDRGTGGAYGFFLREMPLQNLTDKYMSNGFQFWHDLMSHPNYDDFWQRRSLEPHLRNVHCAVMTVGGLFDAEDMYGALHVYQAIEKQNPGIENSIVMGPWPHGGWAGRSGRVFGDIDFGADAGVYFRNDVEFPFFDYHLRGGPKPNIPEALVFETGSNQWDSYATWPPKTARRDLYFEPDRALTWTKPTIRNPESGDTYVSDPAHPVSYSPDEPDRRTREYMITDQHFAEESPYVLTYETPPLDHDITLAGSINADLFVTTTGTDADFVVKVIDAFPDNAPDATYGDRTVKMADYEMLVRWEIMRGRFRNSYSNPQPFTPGKVTPVNFRLNEVNHTFKAGHRIMVQVQSGMFPLVDINPNKFVNIYHASPADFQVATIKLVRSNRYPSHLDVSVLKG